MPGVRDPQACTQGPTLAPLNRVSAQIHGPCVAHLERLVYADVVEVRAGEAVLDRRHQLRAHAPACIPSSGPRAPNSSGGDLAGAGAGTKVHPADVYGGTRVLAVRTCKSRAVHGCVECGLARTREGAHHRFCSESPRNQDSNPVHRVQGLQPRQPLPSPVGHLSHNAQR